VAVRPSAPRGSLPWLLGLVLMSAAVPLLPAARGRTVVDTPFTLDLGNQWIGFATFLRECYRSGRFPLWDPHDLCGMPFLAFAHTGSLYPPWALAQSLFRSYAPAAAFDVFLHLALAACACFLFLRTALRSRPAAFAGALAYAFSGFLFANINFPPSLHSGAWLPLWYAGAFATLRRPRPGSVGLAAVGLAAMIYGGDLEMVVYGGLGLLFEAALQRRERTLRLPAALALMLALALGLLLAAPQLLPALELQDQSIRTGSNFTPAVNTVVLALAPVLALFPFPLPATIYPANHGLDPYFPGILLLLLAAYGLRFPHARRRLLVFPAAAVYVVLFYLPPLSRLFAHVPVLGGLLVPLRLQPALWLFLLLACAQSLDEWAGKEAGTPDRLLPGGRAGGIALIVFALLTLLSLFWFRQGWVLRAVFALFALLAGLSAFRLGGLRPERLARNRYRLALLLIAADLYGLTLGWMPMTDPGRLAADPRLQAIIGDTAGRGRYHILSIRGIIDPGLPYHLGLRLHADAIDAFSRVPPRSAALRLARLYPALLLRREGRLVQYDQMAVRDPKKLDPQNLDLLNRLNVAWIVSRFAWRPPGPGLELEPALAAADLYIYRNRAAWPRAVVETASGVGPAKVSYPASDRVTIALPVNLVGPARVRLSDSWYPGWRAWVDGRETRIVPDELGLRRLALERPGAIEMRFEPASFRLGLGAGLASWAALALVAAGGFYVGRRARRRRNSPGFRSLTTSQTAL